MGRWLILTGGLLIWAAHFLGVYLLASLAEIVAGDTPDWRIAALALSAGCVAAEAGLILGLARRSVSDGDRGFARGVGFMGAGLGLVGIVWQTLPLLIGA